MGIQRAQKLNELTAREWIKFSKSWFTLPRGGVDREKVAAHPATFPDSLVDSYVQFFTRPGDRVLDPFVGVGTTLEVAERLGRDAVGIELEPRFAEFARSRTSCPVVVGDSLQKINCDSLFPDGMADYVFTSPPYWNCLRQSRGGNKDTRHKKRRERGESLFYSDRCEDLGNIEDVGEYIRRLVVLFSGVYRVLKPRGYVTVVMQNLNYGGSLMPIAWQFGMAMVDTGLWDMKGERIWCKDEGRLGIYGYPFAYATNNVHHYCLTFRRE